MADSPSVKLRPATDADAELLFEIAADLDTWEERGAPSPAPLSRAVYDAREAESVTDPAERVRFVVEADDVAVGSVMLFNFDRFAGHAEVGISRTASVRGRGIGTEAFRQLVEFAFVRCNLRRVHLVMIASNLGALRAYEKVGFVLEGRQREHAWVRGHYDDVLLMGLLRSEWQAARDAAPRS